MERKVMNRKLFEIWWKDNRDKYPETPLMERCFHGGFYMAMLLLLRAITVGAALIAVVFLLGMLGGCHDRYRYPCQNPDNFYKEECQKPKCQFTQQCPEYLVAPILEKQIEQSKPAPEASPQR
jgi:hypothetical protein